MAVQVAGTPSFHWCPSLPIPPPFSNYGGHHCSSNPTSSVHTLSSVFSSICSQRTTATAAPCSPPILVRGASTRLLRSRSCDAMIGRRTGRRQTLGRVYSANLVDLVGDGDDEELVRRTRESALKPLQQQREQPKDKDDLQVLQAERCSSTDDVWSSSLQSSSSSVLTPVRKHGRAVEPPWLPVRPEPLEWGNHLWEKNANRTDMPLSLRIIKERKKGKTWDDGIREAGESACCSVNKAFSSMVFIVREVQTHAIRLRELLVDEDLHGILERVHREINSSFLWLFQKVFYCTPTLMVSVMLLLANFTVYSMGHGTAMATSTSVCPPGQTAVGTTDKKHQNHRAGPSRSIAKMISAGRTASVGGSGDGGGKTGLVAGAMDDGRPDEFHSSRRTVLPNSIMPEYVNREEGGEGREDVHSSSEMEKEKEARLWQDMVNEAYRMRARVTDESLLDAGTLRRLVSPVRTEMEPEDYTGEYSRTELMYQQALWQDPDNVLLLSNFAQFIHLVLHDEERAEYYFKRAVVVRPPDAEALSRYASFLWLGKKDLAAAEETYLEAIAADPGNTAHAANYAHFLWSTGGEDTCYPLDADDA